MYPCISLQSYLVDNVTFLPDIMTADNFLKSSANIACIQCSINDILHNYLHSMEYWTLNFFLICIYKIIFLDSVQSCRNEGNIWKVNDCKECRCWNGKIWCNVITCTLIDNVGCRNYRRVPGTCCQYVCLGE